MGGGLRLRKGMRETSGMLLETSCYLDLVLHLDTKSHVHEESLSCTVKIQEGQQGSQFGVRLGGCK